jgi:hypothetical protein
MADPEAVSRYFQFKIQQWSAVEGSAERYIRNAGRPRLAQEFATDPGFVAVCELVHEIGELQLRSHIVQSIEGLVGSAFNAPIGGEMNIVIGAIADACGFKTLGERLVEVGLAATFIGALIAAAAASTRGK